ncbi:hypothetical protein [Bradyrhizobium liaoningense]|uniref:hypothetical protein n=1 Tax=Bradyrhizobium liaoningense TaxID=43992 RepID=UPI0004AEDB59|nr:hypothetical protein [Bradyrhizobium liaoningense]
MALKGGSDDAAARNAAQARADEQARQAKVRTGTAKINALFDGTPYTPPVAPENPFGVGGRFGPAGLIGQDTTPTTPDPLAGNTFKGFTEDFYKGREKAYSDFATPQLEDQLADARKKLTFALARSGTLNSSIRADKEGQLAKEAGTARQGIADTALAQGNQARNAVEGARSDLINTLTSTGDVDSAVRGALARSTALSAPTQFSPIGSLFANFTGALGTQAAAERAQYYSNGAVKAPFNTGLFAPSSSVKVT